MTSARVIGLSIHPVKSTAIRPLTRAEVTLAGLAGDRRWMVVDRDGVLLTAREEHRLFTIVADIPATDDHVVQALRLTGPDVEDLVLDEPEGPAVPVRLHRHDLSAVPAGPEADAWVSRVLGRDGLRLVWCDDPTRRPLNPAYSHPGDHTAFADGYPVTCASAASLRQLNEWVARTAAERGEQPAEPLPMRRFRPNVTLDGDLEPFAEDGWGTVRIGAVAFRVAKAVDRCVMTTIDPDSLATAKEPIRTLAKHRRWEGATWFAMHLIPESTGTIAVGDEVVATPRG